MAADQKTKVILITEIISPYRIPVFNEIAKNPEIDLTVFFLAETEPDRSWRVEKEKIRFRYEVLPGVRIPLWGRFPVFFNPGMASRLKEKDPDIIICGGYHHPSSFLALRYAQKYKKWFLLWCESHAESIREKYFPFNFYRNRFIRACDGFIVPGRKSLDFIQSFGINGGKGWIAPNAVDNHLFSEGAEASREKAEANKKKRGFPSKVILYVGRLVDSKGIPVLLKAFHAISNRWNDVGLVLVGEGRDKKKYMNFCKLRCLENVFFEGFKQQQELPFYYALADLFVLPSLREEWGLVLNEAVASGLPLIATDVTGGAYDLIDEGKNGFRVPAGDVDLLQQRILTILNNPQLKSDMREYSKRKSEQFSPVRCAQGFANAILEARHPCS